MANSAARADDPKDSAVSPAAPRRRRSMQMSIQSKLLVMLLVTSILSAAVVGVVGYQSGRSSLSASAFDRLTEIRQSQSRQLQENIADLRDSLIVYSSGSTATQAIADFTAGFDQLGNATLSPTQQRALSDYYANRYKRDELAQTGQDIEIDEVIPTAPNQQYLQSYYTVPFGAYDADTPDWDAAIELDDAGDGSAWSAANARFNRFFREIVQRFQFEDAMLIDTRGNVVYSAYKSVDLGTNILTGPFKGSALTDAYREAIGSNDFDYVALTDFGDYKPADGPTAWFVTPVGGPGPVGGVLALQFPISKINELMTMNGEWEESGMGASGETIVVGPDDLMRSDSRLFLQNPEAFEHDVIAAGTPPDIAEDTIAQQGTTLVQPVGGDAVELAQEGQRGVLIERDYLGQEALMAYSPVDIPGLRWIVIAKIDTSEAFAPVADFTRRLVLFTVGIILAVCVAALLLARVFVRPIRRLETGTRRIGSGEYGVAIPVTSRDEFGDLTVAFNDMSRSLKIKEELLDEQRRENDRIMASLMPQEVAARYRDGEETITRDHHGATVIFADIVGMDELFADLTSDESMAIVNKLVHQFDAAANGLGVERVRTLRNGYLASCGLNVPRIDNVRRIVDFAIEMQRIIDGYNSEGGYALQLRAGIDTGQVSSGLVGMTTLAYDMWGAAVDLAYSVQGGSSRPGIFVTTGVYDAMRDTRDFTSAGEVTVGGDSQPVWQLIERSA